MNEQRLEAYLDLIQQLLSCPKGKELALLQANQALVDPEFVQVMERVAAQVTAEGDLGTANFLRDWAEELKNALAQPAADAKPHKHGDRTTAYMDLIKQLLGCRKGTEQEILTAHRDLLDAGLVQQMEQVAAMLAEKGDRADANFLLSLSRQLTQTVSQPSAARLALLQQVLQAIQENSDNPQVVYPLLQEDLELLDESFVQVLLTWAKEALTAAEPKQSLKLAADLAIFSDLIRDLPHGNPENLLEIALTGYQIALPMFSREAFPTQWAIVQKHMGEAYCQRIKGDKAENLETAIQCFHAALEVYTRETFPHEWALVQKDLGEAYRHRVRGDRTENLERAVVAYARAWQVYTSEALPPR
jgi:hypothetical protein